jgi:D-serine deaminase-like pyridoxal phosphate-dependent protein
VTSRPAADRLIVDAGSKALAAERLTTLTPGLGQVVDHPELTVGRLYEEQGIVTSSGPCSIPIGARLRLVPNHSCAAANLHDRMLVADDSAIVDAWPVSFRGWRSEDHGPELADLAAPGA